MSNGLMSCIEEKSFWEASTLHFVDDTLIWYGATTEEAKNLKVSLFNFQLATGMAINLTKTGAYYIGNVNIRAQVANSD